MSETAARLSALRAYRQLLADIPNDHPDADMKDQLQTADEQVARIMCAINARLSRVVEDALSKAIAHIQDELGVTSGDVASHCLDNDLIESALMKYAHHEIDALLEEQTR